MAATSESPLQRRQEAPGAHGATDAYEHVGDTEGLLEAARALSVGGFCPGCGNPVPETRKDRRYCSGACRAAASRKRATDTVRRMEGLIQELARLAHGTTPAG